LERRGKRDYKRKNPFLKTHKRNFWEDKGGEDPKNISKA